MKKKIAVLVASALLSGVLCVTAFAADADDHHEIGEAIPVLTLMNLAQNSMRLSFLHGDTPGVLRWTA